MTSFNKLSPAEAERLALLAEECAEVVQVVSKILRHGYEKYNPCHHFRRANRLLLEDELGDVMYAIRIMCNNKDIDAAHLDRAADVKAKSVAKYLHHQ